MLNDVEMLVLEDVVLVEVDWLVEEVDVEMLVLWLLYKRNILMIL